MLSIFIEKCLIVKSDEKKNGYEISGWLKEVTNARNELVHRLPFGQKFVERSGHAKVISQEIGLYRYFRPFSRFEKIEDDILDFIIRTYKDFTALAQDLAENSGYDVEMQQLNDGDIVSIDT